MKKTIVIGLSAAAGLLVMPLLLPLPAALRESNSGQTVRVLDRYGALLYEFRKNAPGSQEWLTFEEIPPQAIQALVDVEDRTFYEHPGVSARGIGRAIVQNLSAGRVVSGGSTITQQLVRIKLQGSRSIVTKVLESYYALRLENGMSKEDILEAYLNSAYFGHQAYGIEAAAKTYVGKSARELSLGETSLLVGLLQSPSRFDPFTNAERAKERRTAVLAAMQAEGHLTAEEAEEAAKADVALAPDRTEIHAPHFSFWVLSRDDLFEQGTEIRTTLDLDLQKNAEDIVAHHLELLAQKNVTSSAVVVLDAKSGDMLAMVGSGDYFDEEHDGAVNIALAPRQPGSAVKPFTYAIALEKGATAATTVADIETQFFTQDGNPYIPRNYDYGYHGLVTYREALANSYNIAAVKVLERIGVGTLLQFLKNAGITTIRNTPEHYGLALTLGDAEVTLLELTRAFGVFARQGKTLTERTLMSDPVDAGKQILKPEVAWLISDILSDDNARLPEFGQDGALNFDFPVAAKTGTTRNSRDNWTIGYTPSVVVGVWVGNADNSPMKGTSGVTGAGPIFHDVMVSATRRFRSEPFSKPESIVEVDVCLPSGKLPTPVCPTTRRESFIRGTEPKEPDDIYQVMRIDTRNGLRASDSCPPQYVREHVYVVFPPELQRWAAENGWKQPPRDVSPLCQNVIPSSSLGERIEGWLMITKPSDHDEFLLDPLVPDVSEKIVLEVSASADVKSIEWYVNGKKIGTGTAPRFRTDWQPEEGEWNIEARTANKSASVTIRITSR